MDVIGVGLGRTGTTSVAKALETLGFGPTYHTRALFTDPEKLTTWWRVVDDGYRDWDAVFDGYRSTVDWPAAAFWQELAEHYPQAKVILTTRDPHKWFTSCRKTIFIGYRTDPVSRALLALMRIPLRMGDPRLRTFRQLYDKIYRRHFGSSDILSESNAVSVFQRHCELVRSAIPADRLLEYSVDEGWEPLCKFLGVSPTPSEEFPHSNDSSAWWKVTSKYVSRGLARMTSRRKQPVPVIDSVPGDWAELRSAESEQLLAEQPHPR